MKLSKVPSWEAHLALRASQGERVAFELLSDIHRDALQSHAMRILHDADDAHDVVQETLMKAFRAIEDFDPERPIKPWLYRICGNCCMDAIRARRREGEPLDSHEHTLQAKGPGVEENVWGLIREKQIIDAIARLPEHYRSIIFMRHFKHMDICDIATELDKPEGTVKSWLFRARALLKKALKPALG